MPLPAKTRLEGGPDSCGNMCLAGGDMKENLI